MSVPRYAVIHVQRANGHAWPIVERVVGGWQSGAHHYPDRDVLSVKPLALAPPPRVFLPGDTVPGGVWVDDGRGEDPFRFDQDTTIAESGDVLVEVFVPDHAAAESAERARREAADAPGSPQDRRCGPIWPVSDPANLVIENNVIERSEGFPEPHEVASPDAAPRRDAQAAHATAEAPVRHGEASAPPRPATDTLADPTDPAARLRRAAEWVLRSNFDRHVRHDLAIPLAALLRAEADRPERGAWDDRVLHLAADLADHILRAAS